MARLVHRAVWVKRDSTVTAQRCCLSWCQLARKVRLECRNRSPRYLGSVRPSNAFAITSPLSMHASWSPRRRLATHALRLGPISSFGFFRCALPRPSVRFARLVCFQASSPSSLFHLSSLSISPYSLLSLHTARFS